MTGRVVEHEVTAARGRKTIVQAKDSGQVKRQACKHWRMTPGDAWTGTAGMKARKVSQGATVT